MEKTLPHTFHAVCVDVVRIDMEHFASARKQMKTKILTIQSVLLLLHKEIRILLALTSESKYFNL